MNQGYYLTNYRKFAELLIYTLSQVSEEINETKALKLLYFADAENYARHGKTISGNVTYYKNHYGPTPNFKILKNLYSNLEGFINRQETLNNEHKSCKLRLGSSDFTFKALSTREMEVIDQMVAKYNPLSLQEVVRLAHFDPPYLASEQKKKIDFEFVKFRKNDDDYEEDLSEDVRTAIANDISTDGRRKLNEYARATA